jgi:hypothetical protein
MSIPQWHYVTTDIFSNHPVTVPHPRRIDTPHCTASKVYKLMRRINLKKLSLSHLLWNMKLNYRHSVTYAIVTSWDVQHKLRVSISRWNSNSNTMECDGLQHDCPAACVIIQRYSSTTFVYMHYHSHKEISGTHLKNVIISVPFFAYKISETA